MVNVIKLATKEKIREQASEWIIRLEDPDLSDDDIDSLLEWLDQSPVHRSEFLELASTWGNFDILSELSHLIPLEDHRIKQSTGWRLFRFGWRQAGLAVTSICVVIALGIFSKKEEDSLQVGLPDNTEIVYTTLIGNQDSIDLADGSYMKLNTNSKVRVDYNDKFRDIFLERGEVHFEVNKDPLRPFVVHVGYGSVTAVGTAFNIRYRGELIGVTVTDGVVEVNTAAAEKLPDRIGVIAVEEELTAPTKASVKAGQKVEFDRIIRFVENVEPEEMDRDLAWQRGMLIFNGDSLEDAVTEITRYTNTKIIINDEAIRRVQIGGYFRTGEIESMLRAFETSFGIAVERVNENLVYLSQKPDFAAE